MTPTADPRALLRRRLVGGATVGAGVVVAAWWWALHGIAPATFTIPSRAEVAASAAMPPLDPARWNANLGRPLSDAPVVAPSAPAAIQLLSIVKRGDAFVATLTIDRRLVHVRVGEAAGGGTVTAIDASGVDLRLGDAVRRLGFGP